MTEFAVVGKRFPRTDAAEKGSGEARFSADIQLKGMLCGGILRSPQAHARIRSIDPSRALALPGVRAVITAADVSSERIGFSVNDEPLLAQDQVVYVGDRVAAVAATDPTTVAEALEAIRVDYEPLPVLLDPEAAMAPGAPLIHEDLSRFKPVWNAIRGGNVAAEVRVNKGDAEKALAEADLVLEGTFRTPIVHQAYLEPYASVASVDATGKLTIWIASQSPFGTRNEVAHLLHLPQTRVRCISTHVGGGFGGKEGAFEAALCASLSLRTGRPVRMVIPREEDFATGRPRHSSLVHLRIGLKKDGTLTAGQARVIVASGGYTGFSAHVTSAISRLLFFAYRVPNLRINGYAVYTNTMPRGAMRAPGGPQAAFAIESLMDEAARRLDMDPVELRLKNGVADGDTSPTGQVFEQIALGQTLERARQHLQRRHDGNGRRVGVGLAVGGWHTGGMVGGCQVRVNQDGTIGVATGAVDIGQGSTTVIAQIVAEELGVAMEDVHVVAADTETTPFDTLTAGSSVTFRMGNASLRAAREAKEQLLRIAGEKLEANPGDLEFRERRIWVRGSPERSIGFAEVARLTHSLGDGPVLGRGSFVGRPAAYDPGIAEGFTADGVIGPCFATQIAEVAVDEETGVVQVLNVANAQDVGRVINPLALEGQFEGGITMGVGQALTEALVYGPEGRVLNPSFLDYKLATALDAPLVATDPVEEPHSDGPFGAKGIGELCLIPTAAAIANAVYDAVGVRIRELPITPDRVRAALRQKQAGG